VADRKKTDTGRNGAPECAAQPDLPCPGLAIVCTFGLIWGQRQRTRV